MQIPDPRPVQNIPKSANYKQTELGIIPQEWNFGKLKDYVAKIGSGITPRGGSQVYLKEGIPLIRSQNVHFDGLKLNDVAYISQEMHNEMENTKLRDNDVLLNITGASLGRCTFVPCNFGEGNVNQHVCIIRPNPNLNAIFLSNFLSSYLGQKMIFRVPNGLSREGLTFKEIGLLPIFIPPIKEQEKVASILSKVDELIKKTDQVIEQTQRLENGLMQRLLTRGIGHTKFKKTAVGEIPEEWKIVNLKDVCTKITDGVHKTPNYQDQGVPFISVNNIRKGKLDFSDCKYISHKDHRELIQRCFPQKGDILLGKVGTLGVADMVSVDFEFSIFVQIALLKPDKNKIIPQYLKYILNSTELQEAIQKNASGTTLKYIGINKISNLKVPLHSTSEQQKIVSILDSTEKYAGIQVKMRLYLQDLKKGLIQKLLTGKIRVKV